MRISDWSSDVCSSDLAQADVSAQRAAVDAAAINLRYTQVRAPISGRIGSSLFTAGALVQAGQPEALATIQRVGPVYVAHSPPAAGLLNLRTPMTGGDLSGTGPNTGHGPFRLPNGTPFTIERRRPFPNVSFD